MSLIPSFFGGRLLADEPPILSHSTFGTPSRTFLSRPHFPPTSLSFLGKILHLSALESTGRKTPEAHVFEADLSGLKKEEVKVEVEDDRVLHISGERNVETGEGRQERQVEQGGA
ncbi:17.5 kDa class I heat shock protein [Morella rubra]|uniref:17.5 kDa class I heat shock protein n=1 Tax=Morella rubra TaxID=262757 RepID=A0A6A1UFI3_9ROSI|nr:17.5 kDa class I heat shock protein [Morella rubra]